MGNRMNNIGLLSIERTWAASASGSRGYTPTIRNVYFQRTLERKNLHLKCIVTEKLRPCGKQQT